MRKNPKPAPLPLRTCHFSVTPFFCQLPPGSFCGHADTVPESGSCFGTVATPYRLDIFLVEQLVIRSSSRGCPVYRRTQAAIRSASSVTRRLGRSPNKQSDSTWPWPSANAGRSVTSVGKSTRPVPPLHVRPTRSRKIPARRCRVRRAAAVQDHYVLKFLGLERRVQGTRTPPGDFAYLHGFFLEFGPELALVGDECAITVGNDTFSVDLQFFHRRRQCLVSMGAEDRPVQARIRRRVPVLLLRHFLLSCTHFEQEETEVTEDEGLCSLCSLLFRIEFAWLRPSKR